MTPRVRAGGRLPAAPLVDLPLQATPEEGPFLRPKHPRPVRRVRRGASRLVLALQLAGAAAVALAGLWAGYARVMASGHLRVAQVQVRGGQFLSEGEVRELLGPAVGENILRLDIEALKGRLRASPWVAEATVTRALPDTLEVEIRERVPLALAELERLYLMDGEGVLIDIYGPRTAGFDLPIVRGLAGFEAEARRDRAQRAGALLADLGDLASEVSEVSVTDSGDLRVVLKGPGEVLLLGPPPCRSRLLTFLGLRRDLAERAPGAEYFDLRFRDRIYAKQKPPPTPPAAVGAPPGPTRPAPQPPLAAPKPEAGAAGAEASGAPDAIRASTTVSRRS
jgi:cell division protein FtsQ